jgi:SAM-dependent methyltransferase
MDAREWDRRWEERLLHAHAAEPSSVVAEALAAELPGRALDLGCGAGRNAVWLAEKRWVVTAVDFSAEALRQARGHAQAAGVDVDWVEADIVEYEPAREAFDLVLVAYIHLPAAERRALLAHASTALVPGGTLLLVGHDLTNLETGAPGPSSPAVLYTPDDVVPELVGLAVERAEPVRRPVVLEDGSEVEAIDALVVATRPLVVTDGTS